MELDDSSTDCGMNAIGFTNEEIEIMLIDYGKSIASSYHAESKIEIKSNDHIKILKDTNDLKSEYDELGRKLLRDMMAKFKSRGDMFFTVIFNNFDLMGFIGRMGRKNADISKEIEELEKIGNAKRKPDSGDMEIRRIAITGDVKDDYKEKLSKMIKDIKEKYGKEFDLKLIEIKDKSEKLIDEAVKKGLKEEDHNKVMKKIESDAEKDSLNFKMASEKSMASEISYLEKETEADLEERIEEIRVRLAREYVTKLEEFEKFERTKEENDFKVKIKKNEMKETTVLMTLVEGYIKWEHDMANEIWEACKRFDSWTKQMDREIVTLPDQSRISGVFEKKHLSGITNLVWELYRKTSPISFTKLLINSHSIRLSEKDTLDKPEMALDQLTNLVSRWDSTNSWKKMADDDYYFSVLLIIAYHPGEFQLKLMKKFISFVDDKDKGIINGPRCVYKSLYEFISLEIKGRELQKSELDKKNGEVKGLKNFNGRRIEEARMGEGEGPFNREIFPKDKVMMKDQKTAKVHKYVAVSKLSSICKGCYPENNSSTGIEPCKYKCFALQSKNCNLYGHIERNCKQEV